MYIYNEIGQRNVVQFHEQIMKLVSEFIGIGRRIIQMITTTFVIIF